uniref:CSON005551 protein n=1 Tax=Culicoides sonorensis TaxID=179676 RepID=A0A336MTT1_CULSO
MENLELEKIQLKKSHLQIDSDEEVWLVQCPKSLDLQDLVGAKVKLGSKTSMKVDDLGIECASVKYPENQTLSIATGSEKLRQIPCMGSIKIRMKSISDETDIKTPVETKSIKRENSSQESPSSKRKKSKKN